MPPNSNTDSNPHSTNTKTNTPLKSPQVTPAEVRQRQQELAKLRALMFYDEQKAKRTKKIKSKMFRKLRKKKRMREEQKERQALIDAGDPDVLRAMEEEAEHEKMETRKTLVESRRQQEQEASLSARKQAERQAKQYQHHLEEVRSLTRPEGAALRSPALRLDGRDLT